MQKYLFFLRVSIIGSSNLKLKSTRNQHYWKAMEYPELRPPSCVRGMTELDRKAFRKTISVAKLKIRNNMLNQVFPRLKKVLLKIERLKPVRSLALNGGGEFDKEIILHPDVSNDKETFLQELSDLGLSESNFFVEDVELTYENWRIDEVLKSVLPEDEEKLTSYSRIGHIVHINLRDHLLPYKRLIGEVLMDKTPGCRTVVNKAKTIESQFRNFEMDLVCGVPDYKVEVRENGVTFEFDFSKVYWNPRLCTEHERIVNLLQPLDVFYDVFAGVGPFSIPAAAKRHCTVLANDLNPESFKWLNASINRNKCSGRIKTFNKDGKDFIIEDLKTDLMRRWEEVNHDNYDIHIVMNLPATAVEFLSAFRGLLSDSNMDIKKKINPLVHVYAFEKGENCEDSIKRTVESYLNDNLGDNLVGIYFVRNVGPNKNMYRISFRLSDNVLFATSKKRSQSPSFDLSTKKICI